MNWVKKREKLELHLTQQEADALWTAFSICDRIKEQIGEHNIPDPLDTPLAQSAIEAAKAIQGVVGPGRIQVVWLATYRRGVVAVPRAVKIEPCPTGCAPPKK
jgi:hypothetical protein